MVTVVSHPVSWVRPGQS